MSRTRRSFHGNSYQVVDIWHAVTTTGKCWLGLAVAMTVGGGILLVLLAGERLPPTWPGFWLLLCVLLATPFGLKVWRSQSAGILLDLQQGTLSFSADDLENNLHDILSMRRFFDHARRISIALHDIERLDNDTFSSGRGQFRKRRFALNLSGDFGSYQLMFSHKQKRDECRSLLTQVLRRTKGAAPSQDSNIAFPY
ncbi:hypothetical protein GO594_23195 [Pseudomonas otitidis]|uniref:Uncharacterized protein n=1 Tax=Metapseudomonas otitidis TaxID=319939 RepID=A0A7X3HBW6_9GAMM|nr:hypothetical protein [Pseudomonas otitidis]MWK58900.1 hypothetical protein [Pseudomonas otitidis]